MSEIDRMTAISDKLKTKNYKLTRQRSAVLEIFEEHLAEHLSVEDVYKFLLLKNIDIGLTTIYRTLDMLEKIAVLQKIDFGDGRTRYEFRQLQEIHHHHHLICGQCGAVIEFKDTMLETLEKSIEQVHKFKIIDHQVKFFGYCRECQDAKQ